MSLFRKDLLEQRSGRPVPWLASSRDAGVVHHRRTLTTGIRHCLQRGYHRPLSRKVCKTLKRESHSWSNSWRA